MNNKDCIQERDEYILQENPDGTKITVRDLQLEVLSIMDEIHRVCVKNNIRYGLMAGSALGIVNYKGFIPWDDDIDVCVMREDWEKFIEALKTYEVDTVIIDMMQIKTIEGLIRGGFNINRYVEYMEHYYKEEPFKKFYGYFPLIYMLGFIMYSGFASPSNYEYCRNCVYLIIKE